MNILIFSHGSQFSGAEKALFDFIRLVHPAHNVEVVFPSRKGQLITRVERLNIKCHYFPMALSLPNPAKSVLEFSRLDLDLYMRDISVRPYDLVVINTIAILPALFVAKLLNVPVIVYAHEYLNRDADLTPHGCSAEYYLDVVTRHSHHILCASEYVRSQFPPGKTSVLMPFNPYRDNDFRAIRPIRERATLARWRFKTLFRRPVSSSLLVIGTKSIRKNCHFAVTVLKALKLRGFNVDLHITGARFSGYNKLVRQLLIRNEKSVYVYEHLADPYVVGHYRKINLVCATSEPFGLTIPESLARGIPVVATKAGGPAELLTDDYLFDIDDIDGCVRIIESIISNHKLHSFVAKDLYAQIAKNNTMQDRSRVIDEAACNAIGQYQATSASSDTLDWRLFHKMFELPLPVEAVVQNIAQASTLHGFPITPAEVGEAIKRERQSPGSAVQRDITFFDVVPFAASSNLRRLYKEGTGLAIELAAYAQDASKSLMLAYILLALAEKRSSASSPTKILFLGDGLGIDCLRFSHCGYQCDYLDFDDSVMSRCAEMNIMASLEHNANLNVGFKTRLDSAYGAIVCLEVIEHVEDPQGFLRFIYGHLSAGGLLFISECFDGIYDRWPTHLYLNERLAGELPWLAFPLFELIDINSEPYAKPFFFKRRDEPLLDEARIDPLRDPAFVSGFIRAKERVGY